MDRITVSIGDFLKNAGVVGLKYMLEKLDAVEGDDYGTADNKQSLWLKRDFVIQADWTDMYFKAFVEKFGSTSAYQLALDKIEEILEQAEHGEWDKVNCKESLKFINDKLLSNSYRSGFENIKGRVDDWEEYELLKTSKLKENMGKEELCRRLQRLRQFLIQPLCEETFSMKSIIYNYINRFWDGKSFLLRANAAKDMRKMFDTDFSEPLRKYASVSHEKAKERCIDCDGRMDAKEKVSIAFMKDQADDLTRKRSAFWNCKVDAYLCPMCAFIYSLAPLGFTLIGNRFVFLNVNKNIKELLSANPENGRAAYDAVRKEDEKYSSWIARSVDILLQEKSKELGNIQVITRGRGEGDRYTFDVIAKDVLDILKEETIRKGLDMLSKHPYIKVGKDYWNIHEETVLNILRYRSQYGMIHKLLKMAIENKSILFSAAAIYGVQLRTNLLRKGKECANIGGEWMSRYRVRDEGYELRKALLGAKGTEDDACIRGTVYQLLNALSVGNVEHFMEVVMRIYCSTKLKVPNAFIECLKDHDTFIEYGYAFLLGLQGSYYEKKEEKIDE